MGGGGMVGGKVGDAEVKGVGFPVYPTCIFVVLWSEFFLRVLPPIFPASAYESRWGRITNFSVNEVDRLFGRCRLHGYGYCKTRFSHRMSMRLWQESKGGIREFWIKGLWQRSRKSAKGGSRGLWVFEANVIDMAWCLSSWWRWEENGSCGCYWEWDIGMQWLISEYWYCNGHW